MFSVIFVHGLFGNPTKTWTKVPPPDRKKQTENVFWPADLLPKVLPEARIWTWGYDADVHKFGSQSSHNTIEEHASNLLTDIAGLVRRSPNNMPIIFVVHSLGGIVVKEVSKLQPNQMASNLIKRLSINHLRVKRLVCKISLHESMAFVSLAHPIMDQNQLL